MNEEIELVEPENIALVRPVGDSEDLVKNMEMYQELCIKLLNENDWQIISGKKFPKRSAWRKLAVAYGVSFTIIDRSMNWDDEGNLTSAEFVVRATAPGGRHSDGWGACSVKERNAGRKANHDIPATAETRAKNRAAADLFGMGEVSAEEVDRNALYINKEQLQSLESRINDLNENQTEVLRGLWKDNKLPKKEYLNDEQLEKIMGFVEQVEMFQSNLNRTAEETTEEIF